MNLARIPRDPEDVMRGSPSPTAPTAPSTSSAAAPAMLAALIGVASLFGPVACSLLDSGSELANLASVEFSEGSPAVDGQEIDYTGSLLQTPSLDKFVLRMVFHVKADNSKNTETASFGSASVKPIVLLHVNSRSGKSITTTVPSFTVAGGETADLRFPIEVPLTSIDGATLRKIVDGDPIPYFLRGSLQFDLLEGTSLKGKGKAELDLASGEIETRPTGSAAELLSRVL